MAKGDDIQDRMVPLGVRVMDLCDDVPVTNVGRHIAGQQLRSGTSAAPNYAEARGTESPNDFVHKLGVALKELNETEIWLEMLHIRGMLADDRVAAVHQECSELCRILAVSRRTARERTKK
jgi:four helix bundle protein